jgi:hypothetical protein
MIAMLICEVIKRKRKKLKNYHISVLASRIKAETDTKK